MYIQITLTHLFKILSPSTVVLVYRQLSRMSYKETPLLACSLFFFLYFIFPFSVANKFLQLLASQTGGR